ncbi:glycosyltransferase family 87 protein [Sphingomonas sp.]|uniref:glycosyltransferase family 87 protein n=1 Tax=Sphingomonas sp. TaxID=28214 RepID=UPI003B009537
MWHALRSGTWLTAGRARRVARVSIAVTVLAIGYVLLTGHGTVDTWGRPIGTDFSNVWTAGRMTDTGRAAAAWDWPRHYAEQVAVHGRGVPFYGWHYPPPFLLVAAVLAWLPYVSAYLIYQGATLLAAWLVARRIVPGAGLLALGFPAVFVCLGHGQNGFLTAALLGGGLLALERRPVLAGVLFGCLCYKPQFAPVLPVLLIAGGQWRALASAAASVAALVLTTTGIWGTEVWAAFAQSLALTRATVIEGAGTGAYKIVSAFAAIRLNGGGVALAYGAQALVSGAAVLSVAAAAWRGSADRRNALVCAAALLATPYAFDYDMVVLGVAIAFVAREAMRDGWRPWERTGLAFAWAAPLIGRAVAQSTGVPLNLLAILVVAALAGRRALPASDHRHAAVDVQRLPGDVAGLAAG